MRVNEMPESMKANLVEAQETIIALTEISKLLNTGLDEETLILCVKLCDAGIHPEALAVIVRELQREADALRKNEKYTDLMT